MRVRLTSRRAAERCAYCHDSLDGVLASCPRCLTCFHKDCRAHLSQCPTLGCNTSFSASPAVAIEDEPPASLAGALAGERLGVVVAASLLFVALAALLLTLAWTNDVLVIAGFLALGLGWTSFSLVRELPFLATLGALLRSEPRRMRAELRSEPRGPAEDGARALVLRLVDENVGVVEIDLDEPLRSPPSWVLGLQPGATVDVFLGQRGVALRSARGELYAAPERRVRVQR